MARKSGSGSRDELLFADGQTHMFEKTYEERVASRPAQPAKPVECLGMTFPSDEARREHFLGKLRERLADPEFRKTPGFPVGSDDDVLRMSDPPYYTACPNPFLADFARVYAKAYDPAVVYKREPFAVDVSVGKTDQLFQLHSYHTKVPYLAIVPSILHYTDPGDLVLDGFCGSGMTGLAAQWCGSAPTEYQQTLESQWASSGLAAPKWGYRRAVLNDLGPAASFIAAGFNLPFDSAAFMREATRVFADLSRELGWMYETIHTDGKTKGRINYTVWGEVFSCPECIGEVNFIEEAIDEDTKKTLSEFSCPHCGAELNKDRLERTFETGIDPITGSVWKRIKFRPARINYSIRGTTYEKEVESSDLAVLGRIDKLHYGSEVPSTLFPITEMYHGSRLEPKGFTRAHHLFLPRALNAIAALWRKANAVPDLEIRRMLLFLFEQGIWTMALLNRYQPQGYKQVNKFLNGVYYVPSVHCEVSPWYALEARASRIAKSIAKMRNRTRSSIVGTGDCASLGLVENSIDYIFTDPPFGENIYYADLNLLVESWYRVITDTSVEAIVDKPKQKGVHEYQDLMRRCFEEYCRVIKPGRWMTVVFSNSSNGIWRAIQEAIGTAGFVVADVRTLDKKQGSYRQVTSTAVKQDLVISAYKPTVALAERFRLGTSTPEGAWAFVSEHLRHVPVLVSESGGADVVAERTQQMLHDRMVAFHVQRGIAVPISGPDFLGGLAQRYPERDGMYFLPDQVAEYDRKRASVSELRQLSLFVNDEASAIQWVRRELQQRPQAFQQLQPQFMKELQGWAKHERTVELRDILEENFLSYDGTGPVPEQIHAYLSSDWKEFRNLTKTDAKLIEKAKDRWYVPDPRKLADLEKLRDKHLLKEFVEYRESKQRKIKLFRSEAVRVGFKASWAAKDYATIVAVGDKLPEAVLQEDPTLLMYYDNASTRIED